MHGDFTLVKGEMEELSVLKESLERHQTAFVSEPEIVSILRSVTAAPYANSPNKQVIDTRDTYRSHILLGKQSAQLHGEKVGYILRSLEAGVSGNDAICLSPLTNQHHE